MGKVFVQSLAARISLRQYCHVQLAKGSTRYLQVPGKTQIPLETDDIFVPLRLEQSGTNRPTSQRGLARIGNRIRIVGDPGSGKSSLVKSVFRETCRQAQYGFKSGAPLPVLVELKRFTPPAEITTADGVSEWAMTFLRESVTSVQGYEMTKLFESYVSGRGILLLLDGLDEVASHSYERTTRAIHALSDALANYSTRNIMVLTMRSQFHQQIHSDFDEQFPPVVHIASFIPSDIYQFLMRWPFPRARLEQVARIYATLTDRPTLREMCRNPLVLAMYVASDQSDAEAGTPDTRTSFYDQVVEELLVTRRSRQLGVTARTTLREQREALLGRLAFDNLTDATQPANAIDWGNAVGLTMELWNCPSRSMAESELRTLAKDTGVIEEEREAESLRFIHLTFCEFLAAKEAAVGRKGGWAQLLVRHQAFRASAEAQIRPRLNEVIPFAVALLPRSDRTDAISEVGQLGSQEILGRCMLETQAYSHPIWNTYVDQEKAIIVDTDADHWDSHWLERLHLFNVVLRDAQDWSQMTHTKVEADLEAMFGGLVESDRARLGTVFTTYAMNDPAAALRLADACGVDLAAEQPRLVITSCSFPPFLTLATQRALSELGTDLVWTVLLVEAGLRDHFVARSLHTRPADSHLCKLLEQIPRRQRWSDLPKVWWWDGSIRGDGPMDMKAGGTSIYSGLLTLVTNTQREGTRDPPALSIVKSLRLPNGLASMAFIRNLCVLATVSIFILMMHINPPTKGSLISTYGLNALIALSLVAWPWTYPRRRRRIYGVIANVTFEFPTQRPASRWTRTTVWLRESGYRLAFGRLAEARAALMKLRYGADGTGVVDVTDGDELSPDPYILIHQS